MAACALESHHLVSMALGFMALASAAAEASSEMDGQMVRDPRAE